MEKKKQKKNNTSVDLEKSIEILNNRMDCSMCSISSDMADVLTRVHKLEDNETKEKEHKEKEDNYFNDKFLFPLGRLALGGLMVTVFIGTIIFVIRDAVVSIIGG